MKRTTTFMKGLPDVSGNALLNFITGRPRRLVHADRYATMPLIGSENVAEHSFFVILYSRILCDYVLADVDIALVLNKALFHDMEESMSGDIIHAFKHYKGLNEEIEKANDQLIKQVFKGLPSSNYYVKTWKTAKDKSIEGQIIAVADQLSVLSLCLEELRMGNGYVKALVDNTLADLQDIAANVEHFSFLEEFVASIRRNGLNE